MTSITMDPSQCDRLSALPREIFHISKVYVIDQAAFAYWSVPKSWRKEISKASAVPLNLSTNLSLPCYLNSSKSNALRTSILDFHTWNFFSKAPHRIEIAVGTIEAKITSSRKTKNQSRVHVTACLRMASLIPRLLVIRSKEMKMTILFTRIWADVTHTMTIQISMKIISDCSV